VSALLALVAAGVYLVLDPTLAAMPAAASGRGVVVGALGLAACHGAGARLLGRRALEPSGWAWALGAGAGLLGAAMTALAFAGQVSVYSSAVVLGAGLLAGLGAPVAPLPRVRPFALLLGALLLAPALFDVLAPPTDTDELSYQLAAPRWMALTGGLEVGELRPDLSRPLPVQAGYAALWALGGAVAPRTWHLGIAVALVLLVRQLAEARFGPGRGDLPALALLGSWSFLREAGLAYNNLPVAFWLLLAAEAVLARRVVAGATMAGLAVAAKYTAAPAAAVLGLVALWDTRAEPGWGRRLGLGLGALLLPVAPWVLRNAADGLHPLFPFAGWEAVAGFVFVYPEKYGYGHGWVDAALLPFNLLFRAEPQTFRFYGKLNLLWGALALGALLSRRGDTRRLALVVAVGFVAWAVSAQLLRYLVPLAGLAALAGGAFRWRGAGLLLFLVSLPANLVPAWERAADRAAVVSGAETEDAFLARELPSWPAVRFVRDHVPAGETVALLNCWPSYWVAPPYVLGTVEDHVPVRHLVGLHGPDVVRALAREGVRWLLVGDVKYLRKSYTFLPESVWRAQLREPQRILEEALERDAERVYAESHHAVWRILDEGTPTP